MHRELRFLVFVNKKSIIRGQMLTVILEEPACPCLSQLMLSITVMVPCENNMEPTEHAGILADSK